MSSTKLPSAAGAARIIAFIGAPIAIFGFAAGNSQAAVDAPMAGGGQAAAASFVDCRAGKRETAGFVVPRAAGGARAMEICNAAGPNRLDGTARALSRALDAADAPAGITSDARMPQLLALRVSRARIDVDPSMDAAARRQKLAQIEGAIKVLEAAISQGR